MIHDMDGEVIHDMDGDIFEQAADAMVCPVNCVGVMGAGLALEFKKRNPAMFRDYKSLYDKGEMKIGKVELSDHTDRGRHVFLFPTKDHWKDDSRLEDIQQGLNNLVFGLAATDVWSISIPALGCGLGGLNWSDVRPLIVEAFESLPNVDVYLFGPKGAKK